MGTTIETVLWSRKWKLLKSLIGFWIHHQIIDLTGFLYTNFFWSSQFFLGLLNLLYSSSQVLFSCLVFPSGFPKVFSILNIKLCFCSQQTVSPLVFYDLGSKSNFWNIFTHSYKFEPKVLYRTSLSTFDALLAQLIPCCILLFLRSLNFIRHRRFSVSSSEFPLALANFH